MTEELSQQKSEFWRDWQNCVEAMNRLYGDLRSLPDENRERAIGYLNLTKYKNDISAVKQGITALWTLDSRFAGSPIPYCEGDYECAVYSLVYLCEDERMIDLVLKIYSPLLNSEYAQESFDSYLRYRICSTMMDDVGHILWEVQGMTEALEGEFFDWHGHRNSLNEGEIASCLKLAGQSPLPHPDFPPSNVMVRIAQLEPFESDQEYLDGLHEFYEEHGYEID